jgi:alginate O-acetyltransferase complex protein AlgJ
VASTPPPIPETGTRSARRESWAAGAALFLFLAWLFLPLAFAGLELASSRHAVKVKEAVRKPILNGRPLVEFLHDFSLYYEKNSPIRPWLIPRYMAFKLYTLGMSSASSVVVGRENWLFMGHESDKVDELRYFLGCNPISEETLEQWLQVLTERQHWLERRRIAYMLIIAPNKSTIYPEYMPAIYPRGRRTRLDQLAGFIHRRAPGFSLLDLRPALQAGKKARLLYWQTDTHWNDFGKDLAYREIVRSLACHFPSLEALPQDAFEVRSCSEPPHDLEDLLLLPCKDTVPPFRLIPKLPLPSARVNVPKAATAGSTECYHSRAAFLPLALIVHDSFGETLKPLLGCHFQRSRWILDRSHAFPFAWIEKRRPRVVIDEIVERYLEEDPWTNPAAIRE